MKAWHCIWLLGMVAVGCLLGQTAPQPTSVATTQTIREDQAEPGPETVTALREQLAELLSDMGVPTEPQDLALTVKLESVAEESADLSRNLPTANLQLEANSLELQARYAQAENARQRVDSQEASIRVGQLRTSAQRAKTIRAPGASVLGDFWLLQADLFDINRSGLELDGRQRRAMERLESFLSTQFASTSDGREHRSSAVSRDVKLALLRLYDQRGLSDKAFKLYEQIRSSPESDKSLQEHLGRSYGYMAILGKPLDVHVTTREGKVWSSREHRGRVVLLHFWADWFKPSVQAFNELRKIHDQAQDRGLSLLSVTQDVRGVPSPGQGTAPMVPDLVDWPVVFQGPEDKVSLYGYFSVRSLPRYAVIDPAGRVAAVGGSLAIMEKVELLLAQIQGTAPAVAPATTTQPRSD